MAHHIATPARLEAFSDGVIAVIITIMVLELKLPHQEGLAALRAVLPPLAHGTEAHDERVYSANLGFLFCPSLLPFFPSYVLEKKMDSFSVAIYVASMILTGFSFLLLRLAIGRRLRHAGKLEAEDTAVQRKNYLSLFVYLVAIPLAFQHPHLALSLLPSVTVIWMTPTAAIKPRQEYPPQDRP